jgi:hypothetical protein
VACEKGETYHDVPHLIFNLLMCFMEYVKELVGTMF